MLNVQHDIQNVEYTQYANHITCIQHVQYVKYILYIILILSIPYTSQAFFNKTNEYRGFYWFEQKTKTTFHPPTSEEAVTSITARTEQLNNTRNQMIELSFRENTPPAELRKAILKYKQLEQKMFSSALRLFDATEMLNFTNPELTSQVHTNVFANKIKRQVNQKNNGKIIKEFGNDFDLLLFTKETCPYSRAFTPIAKNFSMQHQI